MGDRQAGDLGLRHPMRALLYHCSSPQCRVKESCSRFKQNYLSVDVTG